MVSLLVLAMSVALLAWQTREVARQTRIANQVAEASVQTDVAELLQTALTLLVDRPHLRPYFYDCQTLDPADENRNVVLLIAEQIADAVETSLENARTVTSFGDTNLEDWRRYTTRLFADSPALREIVTDRGSGEWPRLNALLSLSGLSGEMMG